MKSESVMDKPVEFLTPSEKRHSAYAPSQETSVAKSFCTIFPPKKSKSNQPK